METRKLKLNRTSKAHEKKRQPDKKKREKRRSNSISTPPPQSSRPNTQMEVEEFKQEEVPPFL